MLTQPTYSGALFTSLPIQCPFLATLPLRTTPQGLAGLPGPELVLGGGRHRQQQGREGAQPGMPGFIGQH